MKFKVLRAGLVAFFIFGTVACQDERPPSRTAHQAKHKSVAAVMPVAGEVFSGETIDEPIEEILCYSKEGTTTRPATPREVALARTGREEANKGHLKVAAHFLSQFYKTCNADAEHRLRYYSVAVRAGGKFCYNARIELMKTLQSSSVWGSYNDRMEALLKMSFKRCPASMPSKYDPTIQTSVPADFACDLECQLDAACVQGHTESCRRADALREQRIKKNKN